MGRVAVATLVVLVLAGCGKPSPPALTGPHWKSASLGFSLDLPEGWKVIETGIPDNPYVRLEAVAGDASEHGGMNLTVFGVQAPEGQSLDQVVAGNIEALRRNRPGVEVRDQKRIRAGGVPVHRVLVRIPGDRGGKAQVIYSVLENGRFAILTFTADAPFEGEVEAAGDAVVGSLALDG